MYGLNFWVRCASGNVLSPSCSRVFLFVDDATKAATINLRKSLIPDTQNRSFPLNFCERAQMMIKPEENLVQQELCGRNCEQQLCPKSKENFHIVIQLLKKGGSWLLTRRPA